MTRAGFLQSICDVATAAIVPDSGQAPEVSAKEINPDAQYVLRIDGWLGDEDREHISKVLEAHFPGKKILILDSGATFEEIRPLGAAEIEAAVARGFAKALGADLGRFDYIPFK